MPTPEELWESATPQEAPKDRPVQQAPAASVFESAVPSGGPGRAEGMKPPVVAMGAGTKAYQKDVETAGEPSFPQAVETFGRQAIGTALMGLPSHLEAWGRRYAAGKEDVTPEERAAMATVGERFRRQKEPGLAPQFKEQLAQVPSAREDYMKDFRAVKEREAALSRLNPVASALGTTTGFVGSMFVPLGPLAKPGQIAEAGATALGRQMLSPKTAESVGRVAGAATTGATVAGLSGYLENLDVNQAIREAGIGAVAAPIMQKAVSSLVGKFRSQPEPLTSSGGWTPQAQKAIDDAFWPAIREGRMTVDDLELLKPKLAEVFRQKGATAAAAQEALIKEAGAAAPTRQQVTGQIPKRGASELPEVREAAELAESQILSKLASEVPAMPTMPNVIAQNLYKAQQDALRAGKKIYKDIELEPGWFKDKVGRTVMGHVDEMLTQYRLPTDLKSLPETYPQAIKAYEYLVDKMQMGRMPKIGDSPAGTVSPESLMAVRKELGKLWVRGSEADKRAIDAIRQGFDNNLKDAVQSGLFSGEPGKILAMMQGADKYWGNYVNTFFGKGEADNIVRKALDVFKDKSIPDPAEAQRIAQGILEAGIMKNKELGPSVYAKLENALGARSPAMNEIRDQLRASVVNAGGDMRNIANNIDNMLRPQNKKLYEKLFDADEIRRMRITSEAIKSISRRPERSAEANERMMDAVMRNIPPALARWVGAGTGAVLGGTGGMLTGTGHPIAYATGAILGAGAGEAASQLGSRIGRARELRRETMGAPTAPKPTGVVIPGRRPGEQIELTPNVPKGAPSVPAFIERESGYEEPKPLFPEPPRTGRATGGRVSDKLVAEVDRAKKRINNQTEELLKTPDTSVAQALEVANRHLEG